VRIGGPVPLSAYAMMWVGDLLGEVLVAAYLGVVLHLSVLKFFWVGRAFGELGKGWVGARWLRRSLGRASTSDQRVRMALWYTMVVTCGGLAVGLAVAARFPLQHVPGADELSNIATRASSRGWAVLVSVVGAAVGCLVLLRYLLLTLFNPRR
jgi:hypothetical protein